MPFLDQISLLAPKIQNSHPLRVHILLRRESASKYVTNMLSNNKSYKEKIKTKERFSAQERLTHRVAFEIEKTNVSWYHLSRDMNEVVEGTASSKALRWGGAHPQHEVRKPCVCSGAVGVENREERGCHQTNWVLCKDARFKFREMGGHRS